jgi:diguanylate cyclase (GGDEF)-like protein
MIGVADYLTGSEIAFSIFYLIPISLVTWRVGRRAGVPISFLSALIWMISDRAASPHAMNVIIASWNGLVRLSFFIIQTLLLSSLKKTLDHEKKLSRTDALTEIGNSRHFFEILGNEMERSRRSGRSFTVVYMDIDDFKTVNDRMGHPGGDMVLQMLAGALSRNLRRIDAVARLGGDEFGILMPETGQEAAEKILERIREALSAELEKTHCPVTLSIGAVTFARPGHTVEEAIKIADDLMYSVKNRGKNGIEYSNVE